MSRNGSGTFTLAAGNPVVTGTVISSTTHNTTMSDIADEITNSLDKDGQTVLIGALDFNGNEIILDVDADTSITADTDDRIDFKTGGTDRAFLSDRGFTVTGDQIAYYWNETDGSASNTLWRAIANTETWSVQARSDDDSTGNIAISIDRTGTTIDGISFFGLTAKTVSDSLTAGTTQTQAGATALTTDINRVATCATNGDGVKLPSAVAGREIIIHNDGAATLQVWPASGDAIDGGSADAADGTQVSAGGTHRYVAVDATNWYRL